MYSHPIHHGYGVWVQTGYHFPDMCYRWLTLHSDEACRVVSVRADTATNVKHSEQALGAASPLGSGTHSLLDTHDADNVYDVAEIDAMLSFKVWTPGNRNVALGSVQCMHSSFSRRA